MNKGIVRFLAFVGFFAGAISLLAIYLGGVGGCGASSGGGVAPALDCPPLPFYSLFAPTLQVSTIAGIPTVLRTPLSFNSTTSSGVITANVIVGPNVYVATALEPLVGTVATLSGGPTTYTGTIAPFTGPPTLLNVTDTVLGSTVTPNPLVFADFGVSAITNDITGQPPSPVPVMAYSAYAGGTLLTQTTAMPVTGTPTYTGQMTGVLADTSNGGSDDVSGNVSLNVDFAAGTISGSLSGITTAVGVSTLVPFSGAFAPINMTPGSGTISGNSFSATVTTTSIAGANIMTLTGNFYGPAADEVAGTFTISEPSPGFILIGSFGGSNGVAASTGKECPPGPFYSLFDPTLSVSTQAIIPTLLMTDISFISTTTNGVTTANVIAGPPGVLTSAIPLVWDGILTSAFPNPPGESIAAAVATLPSSILLASGSPALSMTATSCGGTSGGTPCSPGSLISLVSSDFGMWAIINDVPPTSGSVIGDMTYSAYAGGTLPTTTMPTGTKIYTGKMVGVLADEPAGGGDDLAGDVIINVDFGALTIDALVSNITTTAGLSTLPLNFPFFTTGSINVPTSSFVGNSFSVTATAGFVPTATITTMKGNFYGPNADEVTGTFTISVPNLTNPGRFFIGSFGAK